MRNKIKMFAQKKVTLPPGRHKLIILDEADRSLFVAICSLLLFSRCCLCFHDSFCLNALHSTVFWFLISGTN